VEAGDLPYVDEHAIVVAADPDAVWTALTSTLDTAFSRTAASTFARAVGCADDRASGPRPIAEGSSIPGFRVVTAEPPQRLVLVGRHRFSSYALTFDVDELSDHRSRLRAESRATFPGMTGAVYRMLVVGTAGHAVAVRGLLSRVRRAAESRTPGDVAPSG
jgi:hypothetical protein